MLLLITLCIILIVVIVVLVVVALGFRINPSPTTPIHTTDPTTPQEIETPVVSNIPTLRPTAEPATQQETEQPAKGKTVFSSVSDTDDTYMMPCQNDGMCSSGLKCRNVDNRDGQTMGFEKRGAELLLAKTTLSRIGENEKVPDSMRCRCPDAQVFNTQISKCQQQAGQHCSITSDQIPLQFPSTSISYVSDLDTFVTDFTNDCYFQEGVNTHPNYKSDSKMGCFRNLDPSMIASANSSTTHDNLVLEEDSEYKIGFCIHTLQQTDIGKNIVFSNRASDYNKEDSHIYGHIPNDLRIFKLYRTDPVTSAGELSGVIREWTPTHVTIETNGEKHVHKYDHSYCNRTCQQAPLNWCPDGPWDATQMKCTDGCKDTNKDGASVWKQNSQTCWCSHGPWDATQMKCTDGCEDKILNIWGYSNQTCVSDRDRDHLENFKAFFGDELRKDGTVLM
tara:strand:- start:7828 stop:9174 length:1347 start_codon:yes stop_codon:yes gene_type:complete